MFVPCHEWTQICNRDRIDFFLLNLIDFRRFVLGDNAVGHTWPELGAGCAGQNVLPGEIDFLLVSSVSSTVSDSSGVRWLSVATVDPKGVISCGVPLSQ